MKSISQTSFVDAAISQKLPVSVSNSQIVIALDEGAELETGLIDGAELPAISYCLITTGSC